MRNDKIEIIGREFSTPTKKLLKFLKDRNIPFTYYDLDSDRKEDLMNILKINKVISLPFMRKKNHFVSGYNEIAIEKLLEL